MMIATSPGKEDEAGIGVEEGAPNWGDRHLDAPTHRRVSCIWRLEAMASGSKARQAGGERAVNTTDPRHQAGLGRAQIWVLRYIDQICSV